MERMSTLFFRTSQCTGCPVLIFSSKDWSSRETQSHCLAFRIHLIRLVRRPAYFSERCSRSLCCCLLRSMCANYSASSQILDSLRFGPCWSEALCPTRRLPSKSTASSNAGHVACCRHASVSPFQVLCLGLVSTIWKMVTIEDLRDEKIS